MYCSQPALGTFSQNPNVQVQVTKTASSAIDQIDASPILRDIRHETVYTTSVDISMIFLYNASSVLCIAQSDTHVRTNTGNAIGEKSFQITISGLLSSTNYKAYCKVNDTEDFDFYASLHNTSKGRICPEHLCILE